MVTVKVEGVREAREVLNEYEAVLREEVDREHKKESAQIVREVRSQSPVDKGDYLAGWRVRKLRAGERTPGDRRRLQVVTITGGLETFGRFVIENTTRHAVFVEDRTGILSRATERAGKRIERRLAHARDVANRKASKHARRR